MPETAGTQQGGERRALLTVFLVALVARVAYILAVAASGSGTMAFWSPDSHGYVNAAKALLAEGVLSPEPILLLRTPGYPVYLMPGLWAGNITVYALITQCVLGALTAVIVAKLALMLLGRRAALVAGLICALEPKTAYYASQVLTEIPFGVCYSVALFLVLRYAARRSAVDLLGAGLALAVATYLRPVTIYLPILIGLALGTRALLRRAGGRPWPAILAFLAIAVGLPYLWAIRNERVWGWRTMSSITLVNMYYMNRSAVLAAVTGEPVETFKVGWQNMGQCTWQGRPARWDESERSEMQRRTREALRAHPAAALKVFAQGAAIVLLHADTYEVMRPFVSASRVELTRSSMGGEARKAITDRLSRSPMRRAVTAVVVLPIVALYALAFMGLFRWYGPRFARALMVLIVAYLLAVSSGGSSTGRLRFPMIPILAVLAAAAVTRRDSGEVGQPGSPRA